MIIQICVGSSCHIKGSAEIVELLQSAVAEHHLENDVTLAGSFCTGKCNRVGVTIQVDDEIHTGVTPAGFKEFFQENVLAKLR
nr:(2Fe-2S) ferredoxin domain-containing protein [Clostridia bacterium]